MYELNGHISGYPIYPTSACIDISFFQEDHVLVFKGNETCPDQSYWQMVPLDDLINCEIIQDCVGNALEDMIYNDGANNWTVQIAAHITNSSEVTVTGAGTTANPFVFSIGTIDASKINNLCTAIATCIANNGLPTGVDLFTLDGVTIKTGDTVVTTNDIGNTGLVITSNVNGVSDSTDITSAVQALIDSNTDSVINTVAGHRIATHTAVDNTAVNINETVTTFAASANGYTHTNENGTTSAVVYNVIDTSTPNPKLTITVDGTLVKTIDLNQNDIQINNAGSDFDLTDDSLSFVETNGDTATISFAKYNVTVTTQPNGDQLVYQNGNLLATVYKNAADINYDNTTSGLTATNVQDAIDELNTALSNTTDLIVDNGDGTYTHTEVDGGVVTIDTRKSVLGDAAGSVTTEITTDTPIEVSTNPTQVGVLTDGSKIIVPLQSKAVLDNVVNTFTYGIGQTIPTPTVIGGKDWYIFDVPLSITAPTGVGNYLYTLNTKEYINVNDKNTDIDVYRYIQGAGWTSEQMNNLSNMPIASTSTDSQAKGIIAAGATLNLVKKICLQTMPGLALLQAGGSVDILYPNYKVEFVPAV